MNFLMNFSVGFFRLISSNEPASISRGLAYGFPLTRRCYTLEQLLRPCSAGFLGSYPGPIRKHIKTLAGRSAGRFQTGQPHRSLPKHVGLECNRNAPLPSPSSLWSGPQLSILLLPHPHKEAISFFRVYLAHNTAY